MASGPALILETLDKHLTGPGEVRLFGGAAFVLGYGFGQLGALELLTKTQFVAK